MSRLWSKIFGRERQEPAEPEHLQAEPEQLQAEPEQLQAEPEQLQAEPEPAGETVEVQAVEPDTPPKPLSPPEVAPQPQAAEPAQEPEPEPAQEPDPGPEPDPRVEAEAAVADGSDGPLRPADVEARLGELLDSLGSAHRRPFVRNG